MWPAPLPPGPFGAAIAGGGMTAADLLSLSDGTLMDTAPTSKQLALMRLLAGGDRIVPAIGGKRFELERAGDVVPASTVEALLRRHWVLEPQYPLLADQYSGRLTTRGMYAVARGLGTERRS
jgi:hypothetical protein